MKRSVYAICGSVMVITATILATFAGGSLGTAFLVILGLVLLVTSADPARASPR
ncbi:MAG: hypothetical protein QM753_08735 [Thermomicrobiales bacterium]